jgi:hypothetical protein
MNLPDIAIEDEDREEDPEEMKVQDNLSSKAFRGSITANTSLI